MLIPNVNDNPLDRLAVFHNLPTGGGTRMLESIIDRYKRSKKIEVFVVGESRPKKIVGVTTNYYQIKPWKSFFLRNLWIIFVLPMIHKRIANTINRNYKKILVTHDYFTKSPYILKYLKVESVYLCQEPQREFYESWKIHSPSMRSLFANILRFPIKIIDQVNTKNAWHLISNSRYSKEVINRVYRKESSVVYPGVNSRYFNPGRGTKEKLILSVGGLNSIKNQVFLVESLEPLLREYTLVLVGDGDKEYIKKIKNAAGQWSKIKILKDISDEALRSLYRRAVVTVITAHHEPFGLSSIESQACGTPVVAVDEGGVKETILNGESGYLVERDKELFLRRVRSVLDNGVDMGKRSRNFAVLKWDWKVTLKSLDKYLSS